jgi:hypothetical protein
MGRAFRWTSADLAAVQARGYQLELGGTSARPAPAAAVAPSAARSERGRAAQRHGRDWEDLLEEACRRYLEQGLADVERVQAPYRILPGGREGGVFRAVLQPGPVDFRGWVAGPPARGVAFDAKSSTNKTSFGLGAVETHQARHLLRAHRTGAMAGVALLFQGGGPGGADEAFWIPALPTGDAALTVPAGWCTLASDPRRELWAQARAALKKLGREPGEAERRQIGAPEVPVVRRDRLRAAGLAIPLGWGGADWLPVALQCAAGVCL